MDNSMRFNFDFSLSADANTNSATDANEDNGADHPTNRQWIILKISFLGPRGPLLLPLMTNTPCARKLWITYI